jgi:hypothetical protein
MSYYKQVYYTLCESGKQYKESYLPYSGLHKHHIIPKHSGGTEEQFNFTYLNVRQHIIAHFLLWKIHGNVNDLRSMKMLGAQLSTEYRRKIGSYCFENKIGIHGYTTEQRVINQNKGWESQKKSGNKNTFYYWTTSEGRKERASLGGKKSIASLNNPWSYWSSIEGRKKRCSMGGKSHIGKKSMYKPGDETFIRVPPEKIQSYLDQGYTYGSPITSKTKGIKTNTPSVRRKKVTDGIKIYDSVEIAAKENGITSGAVVYRCKSKKNLNWIYVYENEFSL